MKNADSFFVEIRPNLLYIWVNINKELVLQIVWRRE